MMTKQTYRACAALHRAIRSSCFSRVMYAPAQRVLTVVFRETGNTYAYYRFDPGEWLCFINAVSLGSHYNAYIKDRFPCERVG